MIMCLFHNATMNMHYKPVKVERAHMINNISLTLQDLIDNSSLTLQDMHASPRMLHIPCPFLQASLCSLILISSLLYTCNCFAYFILLYHTFKVCDIQYKNDHK